MGETGTEQKTDVAGSPIPASGSEMQTLIQRLLKQTSQPRTGLPAPPPPSQVQQAQQQQRPMQSGPFKDHNEGTQGFLYNLGASIHNAVAANKEKQTRAAMADYSALSDAWDRAEVSSGGDPAKAKQQFEQDPIVQAVLGDPKKMKNIAKAFSMDALNPEKQTVYGEALKRWTMVHKSSKMMEMMQKLHLKSQQKMQLDQQQQQAMVKEQAGKVEGMMQPKPLDVKGTSELLKNEAELTRAQADLTKAEAEAREKYKFIPTLDGKIAYVGITNPKEDHGFLKDTETGEDIKGAVKSQAGVGKPISVPGGSGPIGIGGIRDGKFVVKHPGDPDWTGDDAKTYSAAKASAAAGEAAKTHRIEVASQMYANARSKSYQYPVLNTKTGQMEMVNSATISANPEGTYAPATGAMKVRSQQAIFGEIDATSTLFKQTLTQLGDEGFSPVARAQLAVALRSTNPSSALDSFLTSEVGETLTDAQVQYVVALASMQESSQALRTVAGLGQGSDMMRSAILKMIPSAGTPTKAYAETQMKTFNVQLDALRKQVMKLGKENEGGATPPGSSNQGETVIDLTHK